MPEEGHETLAHSRVGVNGNGNNQSPPLSQSPHPQSPPLSRLPSRSQPQTPSSPPGTDDKRGRRHSRFSLAAVSNSFLDAVKDRVRSSSREGRSREGSGSREVSRDRGRTLEPRADGAGKENVGKEKASTFSKILKLDGGDDKQSGDGWKEFKKGITSPLSRLLTHTNHH